MAKRRMLLTCGVVTALVMSVVGTAGPAWGAPPPNDDIAGAVVITEPLPFTFTESTVEATTTPEEEAFNSFCGAPVFEHAVWFTATSTLDRDIAVDVSASDYSAGILVLTGTPGDLTPINCGPGRIGGPVTAGQTYYLLIFGDGLTTATSGNLVMTVANAFPLNVRLESPVAPLTFSLELAGGTCDPGTLQIDDVNVDGTPVTPLSVTLDPSDANRARMVLASDTPAGGLNVNASCLDGEETIISDPGFVFFVATAVTKVVEGTPPPGSTFTVHVACSFEAGGAPVVETDLQYPSSGGLQYVYSDILGGDCAFTEPVNGGALSSTIAPGHISVFPGSSTVTVTNSFVARAVAIQPRFTG
jgi:hypothetical protein